MARATAQRREEPPMAERRFSVSDLLKIHSCSDSATFKKLFVIDIGSNSIKADSYKLKSGKLESKEEFSEQRGLGADSNPAEPNPRLNQHGIDQIIAVDIPALKNIIQEFCPDKIVVVCTEAVRAAYLLGDDEQKKIVEDFIEKIAKGLGIPPEKITIASEKLEIILTEDTAKAANIENGLIGMGGGNSIQWSEFLNGKNYAGHRALWRLGTRSMLHYAKDVSNLVTAKIKNSFLQPNKLQNNKVYLLGGMFRFVGRLLAERVWHKNPVTSKTSEGGYTFKWSDIRPFLQDFTTTNSNRLFRYTFGRSEDEILNSVFLDKKVQSVTIRKGYGINNEVETVPLTTFLELSAEWKDKIGKRAAALPYVAQTMLALGDYLFPRDVEYADEPEIVISKSSMRDAIAAKQFGLI